jgi:tetratricopeptide (TPR) repeat protein
VTAAYISRIEAGERQPSVKALRMLAQRLAVAPEFLETGSEFPPGQRRELLLAESELRLRLDGETDAGEVRMVLADAEADIDVVSVVRAHVLLGLIAANAGDDAGTIAHLEQVVDSELVTPCSRPDVYATLGHAYASAGSAAEAVALFEHALAELSQMEPDNRAAEVRYATYLSYALTDLGDIERARTVLADLWARSVQVEDRYTRVRLYWSLGRVAVEEGKPLAALDSFRRAIALLEATEDSIHLARAHTACAEAVLEAGDAPADASRHLTEAERLLEGQAAPADLAVIRRLQAVVAMHRGDPVAAATHARAAIELARGTPRERGRAFWTLAEARALTGSDAVDAAFSDAIELLEQYGTTRDLTGVLRAYGRYLRSAGRDSEAFDMLERAAGASALRDEQPLRGGIATG